MTLLTAETREYLQYIVNVLERVCNRMGLKINVGNVGESCEKVKLNGEEMQEIDTFKYIITLSKKILKNHGDITHPCLKPLLT